MKLIFSALISLAVGLATLPNQAHAVGCISGAVVGGVAGHVAGHHGFLGAAAGCAIGHHQAVLKKRQAAATRAQAEAAQGQAAQPPLATPSGQ
jgi:hypothetical protein